jgi:hypothetical protein
MAEGLWNLFNAALCGNLAVIREALQARADVDARDDALGGRRASLDEWRAHAEQYEDGVGPVRINERFRFGRTPLLHAASAGRVALVRELIAAGADVTARDALGYTALTLTLIPIEGFSYSEQFTDEPVGQDEACALALIAAGADVDASSFLGETALILAAGRGLVRVVEALIAAGASLDGRNASIRALIAAGADVNARERDGSTALAHAIETRDAILSRDPTSWPLIPRELLEAALPKADGVISILRTAGAED